MRKGLQWKLALTLAIIGLSVFLATPLKNKIHLGLDLKGGVHLALQVLTDDAINLEAGTEIQRLQEQLKKKDITAGMVTTPSVGKISLQGLNPDQEGKLRDLLDEQFKEWDYSLTGERGLLTLKYQAETYLRDQAVSQAVETIRNRVDQFGVAEPLIQRQGNERIVVELPGVEDPERVKDLIKVTAILEWKLVKAGPAPDEATLLQPFGGQVPEDAQVVKGDPKREQPGFYLVEKVPTVSGKDLRVVRRSTDEWNNPAVAFSLNPEGAKRFEAVTGANVGKNLAIVLDGRVQSAPVINTRISADGIIQGHFDIEAAEDLVVVLKSGALPAGIKYLEERSIGPSLGADSIRQGMLSGLIAVLSVMAFMIFFYKLSGTNAVAALILNVVILFGALAYFKANLTLPGIAGIILSIGMSVDANVLIFERIKEERALGKGVLNSIATGFSRAFTAIFDSNLTTIISAVFLFQFGTGPIKGYAVTLTIGLTANLFTAVFVSRLLFDLIVPRTAKGLSI